VLTARQGVNAYEQTNACAHPQTPRTVSLKHEPEAQASSALPRGAGAADAGQLALLLL
jgi:hypothetical protein